MAEKQIKNFMATTRDIEIIQFINEFGFCYISHLNERFQLKSSNTYQVMQRLVFSG